MMVEVQSLGKDGIVVGRTEVTNINSPASVIFDAYEAIDSGKWARGCGSMEWVQTYSRD